jgi:hypothetical protein
MDKKLNRVYEALFEGADGLARRELCENIIAKAPKTSSKRIVKASLLALTDPDSQDQGALERIYDAIQHRLSLLGVEEDEPEDDDVSRAPAISDELKARLEALVAPLPPLPLVATAIAASDTR